MDDAFYITSDLKDRGWTDSLIARFLGEPDLTKSRRDGGEYYLWAKERVSSVEAEALAAKRRPAPAQEIDILAALWVINRRAKRCRDAAQRNYRNRMFGLASAAREEKECLYELKGQALAILLHRCQLSVVGHHKFPNGLFAEVLEGAGFRFHRPCPPVIGEVALLDGIEAKPRGKKEPRLTDALHTVKQFVAQHAWIEVYEWPAAEKRRLNDDEDEWDDHKRDYW